MTESSCGRKAALEANGWPRLNVCGWARMLVQRQRPYEISALGSRMESLIGLQHPPSSCCALIGCLSRVAWTRPARPCPQEWRQGLLLVLGVLCWTNQRPGSRIPVWYSIWSRIRSTWHSQAITWNSPGGPSVLAWTDQVRYMERYKCQLGSGLNVRYLTCVLPGLLG